MACTVAAFSVAPSARPSTCFAPPVEVRCRSPPPSGDRRHGARRSGAPRDRDRRAALRPRQPGLQLASRQRHETARDRRLRGCVTRCRRQIAARIVRRAHRAVHTCLGLSAVGVSPSDSSPRLARGLSNLMCGNSAPLISHPLLDPSDVASFEKAGEDRGFPCFRYRFRRGWRCSRRSSEASLGQRP